MPQQERSNSEAMGLSQLSEEHELIRERYAELEEAIFHGHGSERIMESSALLVELLLNHCIHEARFMAKIAPFSEERLVTIRRRLMQLSILKKELKQGEIYAALHLRSFCKQWVNEHLHMEEVEFGPALAQNGEMLISAQPE